MCYVKGNDIGIPAEKSQGQIRQIQGYGRTEAAGFARVTWKDMKTHRN